jgi:hypothetical protein
VSSSHLVGSGESGRPSHLWPVPSPAADPRRDRLVDEWFLVPSSISSASWLCHVDSRRSAVGYVPPGVALEELGNIPTFGWRLATWPDLDLVETGTAPVGLERLNFRDVLGRLPEDRPELDRWADEMMRAHLARLRWYVGQRPEDPSRISARVPGVQQAVVALRSLQGEYRRARFHLAPSGSSPLRGHGS